MIHHVGVATDEKQIEKLKQLGREFIAREQLKREQASNQESLFETDSPEQRLLHLETVAKTKLEKKSGRKPAAKLVDVLPHDLISLADLSEEQRVIEGIHDVAGHVYEQLGYGQILARPKDKELLRDLVLMRLAEPSSKNKAQQILHKRFARCHDLDAMYRLMDKLYPKIDELKTATFKRTREVIPETIDIMFFDCTTLYFESTDTDDLRAFGYSKDHRFNTTQVVLALATSSDGLPIGYELFEGNKAEVKTLLACLDTWKKIFKIGSVCFVADRAMMSEDNLKSLEEQNYSYVIAAKLRSLPTALKADLMLEKNYTAASFGEHFGWVGEFDYKSRRLIVSYKTDRARRDAYQRNQIVEKISKRLGAAGEGDTQKLISNQGVKKYTKSDESVTVLDQEKIDRDAQWDGFHGVITNIKQEPAMELLARYARLWKIEESFRINKHTLSMRPIYHFKPERIKAHIALCYMAFSVLRHMEYVVKVTQKISLEVLLDELIHVQASIYRHAPTGKRFRMPGKFTQLAARIYKAFQLQRKNHAQEIN
jgi:transposase